VSDRKLACIRDADELPGWVVPDHEGRQRDGGEQRLQAARRQGDEEPTTATGHDLREVVGQSFQVPVVQVRMRGGKLVEAPLRERPKVVAQEGLELPGGGDLSRILGRRALRASGTSVSATHLPSERGATEP
jgi:hypothetical protein